MKLLNFTKEFLCFCLFTLPILCNAQIIVVDHSGTLGTCSATNCTPTGGSQDVTFDCILFSDSPTGNMGSASFIDLNPSTETIVEILVTIHGVGDPGSTTVSINGTTIQTLPNIMGAFGCGASCQFATFNLVNMAGIPGYIPGGTNTLEISTDGSGRLCSFFAEVEAISLSALPVELNNFKASQEGINNQLDWQTVSEIDNEGFYVERSSNGYEWETLDFILGMGTSFTTNVYDYMDEKPLLGMNYYRLMQMDYNGETHFSEITSVDFKTGINTGFSLFPNPSPNGKFNMNYTSALNEEVQLNIYDMTGRLLIQEFRSVVDGNNEISFDLSELGKGLFIATLQTEEQQFFQKLLIK